MGAAKLDLVAESRQVSFIYSMTFEGQTWPTPFFSMQARLDPGAPGDPLVDLSNASSGAEGIYPTYPGSDTVLTIQIDKDTLKPISLGGTMPDAGEPGDDLVLYYDLKVTPLGPPEELLAAGTLTIKYGVTRP